MVSDDGKVGTEHQCIGLAEALEYTPEIIRLRVRGIWKYLPASLWISPLAGVVSTKGKLSPPWPDLIIGAGRLSVAPTAYIRKITKGRTRVIQLQNPRIHPDYFDAVIAPWHDRLVGDNVLQTKGALHRVTRERLQVEGERTAPYLASLKRPLIAVLIGGSNRCYRMEAPEVRRMAQRLKHMAERYQAGLAITFSRRTKLENRQIIKDELKDTPALVWMQEDYNPYYGFLALADYIVVTCDSVSMISEACFTGKPVYTYFLPGTALFSGGSRKFKAFHRFFQEQNYTRPFEDELQSWSYEPLDEFSSIVQGVHALNNM